MRQEVRSLLCCLKALDDPADGISLVGALRSPFSDFPMKRSSSLPPRGTG